MFKYVLIHLLERFDEYKYCPFPAVKKKFLYFTVEKLFITTYLLLSDIFGSKGEAKQSISYPTYRPYIFCWYHILEDSRC